MKAGPTWRSHGEDARRSAFLIGLTIQSTKICVDAIVQAYVDDAFRGRVFSFYDMIYNAAFVASAAVAALVLHSDGYWPPSLLGMAGLYVLAAVGYARATRMEPSV